MKILLQVSVLCCVFMHVVSERDDSRASVYEILVDSLLDFSISCYTQLARNRGYQENMVFSPFSIYTILLMAHLGSRGHTAHQICQALRICHADMSHVHEAFGKLVKDLMVDPSLQDNLAIANSLFIQKELSLSRFYRYALRYLYGSTLREVDFQNSSAAQRDINYWVMRETRGKIPNILLKSPSEMTRVVMVNALHFRGEWKWQFDPASTEPQGRFFVTPHLRVQVPMMSAKLILAMGNSRLLEASILELPFAESRISMFLILPDKLDGLPRLQRSLNSTSLKQLISTMKKTEITVRLPRFTVDQSPSLTAVLWTLGVRDLFSPSEADLRGISEYDSLHVTDMFHRAQVYVDEKGSIFSAATATVVERIGAFNGRFFEANHPFIFLIMDKQSGVVLSMGRIAGF